MSCTTFYRNILKISKIGLVPGVDCGGLASFLRKIWKVLPFFNQCGAWRCNPNSLKLQNCRSIQHLHENLRSQNGITNISKERSFVSSFETPFKLEMTTVCDFVIDYLWLYSVENKGFTFHAWIPSELTSKNFIPLVSSILEPFFPLVYKMETFIWNKKDWEKN